MTSNSVISDSTDPATMRPDLPPAIATETQFIPMILPDFCPKISLSSYIKPDNAWALFELFFSKEQLEIIIKHINDHIDYLDLFELDEKAENKTLHR